MVGRRNGNQNGQGCAHAVVGFGDGNGEGTAVSNGRTLVEANDDGGIFRLGWDDIVNRFVQRQDMPIGSEGTGIHTQVVRFNAGTVVLHRERDIDVLTRFQNDVLHVRADKDRVVC